MSARNIIALNLRDHCEPDHVRVQDPDYARRALQTRLEAIGFEQKSVSSTLRALEQQTEDLRRLREIMDNRAAALEKRLREAQEEIRRQREVLLSQQDDMDLQQADRFGQMGQLKTRQRQLEKEKTAITLALSQGRLKTPAFPAFRAAFSSVANQTYCGDNMFYINRLTGSSAGSTLVGGTC